jgi:hypothetical protein
MVQKHLLLTTGVSGRSKNENKRSCHERKRNVLRRWRAEGEVREFESQRGMSSLLLTFM